MRIIYFYVSNGCAGEKSAYAWDKTRKSSNFFAENIWTEGPWKSFAKLAEKGIIDEVITFIDSTRGPGVKKYGDNNTVYTVPHIREVLSFIKKEDILIVRGGFKSWYPVLDQICKNRENWILFYRANTNRGGWPFWDIILDDCTNKLQVSKWDRLIYPYVKPINEDIFKLIPRTDKKYDVMIGASHIHEKKGQLEGMQALATYKKLYINIQGFVLKRTNNLKAVMPGRFIKTSYRERIMEVVRKAKLDVEFPGMIPRKELAKLMNATSLYIHLGHGGQNDRGPMEAMKCGCRLLIANPPRFAPFIYQNPQITMVGGIKRTIFLETDHAGLINAIIGPGNPEISRKEIVQYYDEKNGMEQAALPNLMKIIDFIRENPIPNRTKLSSRLLDIS